MLLRRTRYWSGGSVRHLVLLWTSLRCRYIFYCSLLRSTSCFRKACPVWSDKSSCDPHCSNFTLRRRCFSPFLPSTRSQPLLTASLIPLCDDPTKEAEDFNHLRGRPTSRRHSFQYPKAPSPISKRVLGDCSDITSRCLTPGSSYFSILLLL